MKSLLQNLRTLWPKYPPFFFTFCYLKRLCLYNWEISLALMLRQLANSKTNMTKNRDKITKNLVISKKLIVIYFCHIAQPYVKVSNSNVWSF